MMRDGPSLAGPGLARRAPSRISATSRATSASPRLPPVPAEPPADRVGLARAALAIVSSEPPPRDIAAIELPLRGSELHALRDRLGLQQEGFAYLFGVSVRSVCRWEQHGGRVCVGMKRHTREQLRATLQAIGQYGDDLVEEVQECLVRGLTVRALGTIFNAALYDWG